MAAAVVVAIALVVARDGNHAVPADQPARTGTPTTPPRALFGIPDQELLVPGTYFVDEVDGTPTPRIFVTIGAGWSSFIDEGLAMAGPTPGTYNPDFEGGGFVSFSRPDKVYLDACHLSEGFHPGPVTSLHGLVTALSEQDGWADVTAPSDISVDGYRGKTFQRHRTRRAHGLPQHVAWAHENWRWWRRTGELAERSRFKFRWGVLRTGPVRDFDGPRRRRQGRRHQCESVAGVIGRGSRQFADVLDSIRIDRRFDSTNPEVATPLESVRGSQTSGADIELFRVTTDEPMYWRVATLPEFDGRTWVIPESPLSPIDGGADPPPGGRTVRQQLEILALKGRLVPAAADPTHVDSDTEVRFNADMGTLVTLSELATGDRFTIVSKAPNVTLDELRAATAENPPMIWCSRSPTASPASCPTSPPRSQREPPLTTTA